MNRLFLREKEESFPPLVSERIKIGVGGICHGGGATVVGTTIAKIASKKRKGRIKFLEITDPGWHKPLVFDSLGMDKRFSGRDFFDFYAAVSEGNPIRGKANVDEGISWALYTQWDLKNAISLNKQEKIYLINNMSYDTLICDISCANSNSSGTDVWDALAAEMDVLVMVIDPMPSRLLAGFSLLNRAKFLEEKGKEVIWVVNKFNDGIHKRDLFEYLRIKRYTKIPLIGQEKFYTYEYNCRLPYHLKELVLPLSEMIEKHEIFT